jgi:hypothetical protein
MLIGRTIRRSCRRTCFEELCNTWEVSPPIWPLEGADTKVTATKGSHCPATFPHGPSRSQTGKRLLKTTLCVSGAYIRVLADFAASRDLLGPRAFALPGRNLSAASSVGTGARTRYRRVTVGEGAMWGSNFRIDHREQDKIATALALGAASSSCSYAAVALSRSLFRKGADFTAAMAFEMASTNLVLELSKPGVPNTKLPKNVR